ncbi:CCA tRNA nucleotidyltransferase [Thermaurantiacus sp.]
MTRLDPGLWLDRPGMARLLEALGAAEGLTRLVGGAVRDALLCDPVADIDLATRLRPEAVIARLKAARIRAVPTGLPHGTITAVAGGAGVEVTSLRADVATDGRRAVVAFTDDWATDAARRDFTVNALYADPLTGETYDWFGGVGDLRARRVRFIGDPFRRIAEDHLRILRFFRFTARLEGPVDPAGLEACVARARDLLALSRERVQVELLKLLALPGALPVVELMAGRGVLAVVLPEATDIPRLRALVLAETAAGVAPDALRRLAALLPDDPELGEAVARRLRLSRKEGARLAALLEPRAVPPDPRALAYRAGADVALDRLLLTGDARAAVWVPRLAGWERPRLALTGKDLIAMGLEPGPVVARTLAEVERRWVEAGFPPDATPIAREVLGLA